MNFKAMRKSLADAGIAAPESDSELGSRWEYYSKKLEKKNKQEKSRLNCDKEREMNKFTEGEWEVEYGNLVVIGGMRYELENKYDASLIKTSKKLYDMLQIIYDDGLIIADEEVEDEILTLLTEARGGV